MSMPWIPGLLPGTACMTSEKGRVLLVVTFNVGVILAAKRGNDMLEKRS